MNPDDVVVIFVKCFGDDEVYWAPETDFNELRNNKSVEFIMNEDDEIIWDAKDAASNPGDYFCV